MQFLIETFQNLQLNIKTLAWRTTHSLILNQTDTALDDAFSLDIIIDTSSNVKMANKYSLDFCNVNCFDSVVELAVRLMYGSALHPCRNTFACGDPWRRLIIRLSSGVYLFVILSWHRTTAAIDSIPTDTITQRFVNIFRCGFTNKREDVRYD